MGQLSWGRGGSEIPNMEGVQTRNWKRLRKDVLRRIQAWAFGWVAGLDTFKISSNLDMPVSGFVFIPLHGLNIYGDIFHRPE